ncbi:MAG: matrixin family metalloprotease [Bacteriovoracaceae bacterium]
MKIFFSFILITSFAQAFTLNNNFGGAFKTKKVKVSIAGNTTCNNIGLTIYDLEELIAPAVNNFWNEVPTSSLRLKPSGFTDSISNINAGRLCAPTDDGCISGGGGNVIPAVDGIVIACNSLSYNFNGANVIAVTIPNNFSGKKIKGAVILINNVVGSTAFSNLSHDDKIAVIAHEIGHAIGLGHAKNSNKEALMYYKTVNLRKNLAQDDVDGVSYLYPVTMDGCGLFTATIKNKSDDDQKGPPFWPMGLMLLTLIALFEIRKIFRLSKNPQQA